MATKKRVSKQHMFGCGYDSTIFVSQISFSTHLLSLKNNLIPDYSIF
ncbi:MAG: hypothetical protein IKV88_08000 [Clostridia bacterium]|nr:hypothetical protein [Clostridia bacterium]